MLSMKSNENTCLIFLPTVYGASFPWGHLRFILTLSLSLCFMVNCCIEKLRFMSLLVFVESMSCGALVTYGYLELTPIWCI